MAFTRDGETRNFIWIYAHPSTIVYKETKDVLTWAKGHGNNYLTVTYADEWEIEEI